MKYTKIPAISGKQLLRLLKKDGWFVKRRTKHGLAVIKRVSDRTIVTIIPGTRASLDEGTLMAILGSKQTKIGKKGLIELLNKYGL